MHESELLELSKSQKILKSNALEITKFIFVIPNQINNYDDCSLYKRTSSNPVFSTIIVDCIITMLGHLALDRAPTFSLNNKTNPPSIGKSL